MIPDMYDVRSITASAGRSHILLWPQEPLYGGFCYSMYAVLMDLTISRLSLHCRTAVHRCMQDSGDSNLTCRRLTVKAQRLAETETRKQWQSTTSLLQQDRRLNTVCSFGPPPDNVQSRQVQAGAALQYLVMPLGVRALRRHRMKPGICTLAVTKKQLNRYFKINSTIELYYEGT
jgi:hypothetical protein